MSMSHLKTLKKKEEQLSPKKLTQTFVLSLFCTVPSVNESDVKVQTAVHIFWGGFTIFADLPYSSHFSTGGNGPP